MVVDNSRGNIKNILESYRIATQALKKQTPKKVIELYELDKTYVYGMYGECPSCKHTGLKQHSHMYCWWCGQKLNWD